MSWQCLGIPEVGEKQKTGKKEKRKKKEAVMFYLYVVYIHLEFIYILVAKILNQSNIVFTLSKLTFKSN